MEKGEGREKYEVCDMVSQFFEISFTATFRGARGVGRTHVSRYDAQYIPECHFILVHLVLSLRGCDIA
jgi:hypothetical protein